MCCKNTERNIVKVQNSATLVKGEKKLLNTKESSLDMSQY